jgi:hypothetical protein
MYCMWKETAKKKKIPKPRSIAVKDGWFRYIFHFAGSWINTHNNCKYLIALWYSWSVLKLLPLCMHLIRTSTDECVNRVAQSVWRLTTGWTVRGSNPGGARFSTPVQTSPGAHLASCTMGTGSFPGVKSGRGATLTPHSLLVPWSRKGRAITLLPLWAIRPVQSLSAVPISTDEYCKIGVPNCQLSSLFCLVRIYFRQN